MKKNIGIIIITFVVFALGMGFFGVTNAASNLFECAYRSGGGASDCYADENSADCDDGKVVVNTACDRFDDRPDLCSGAQGRCKNPSSIECDEDKDCSLGYVCSSRGTCAPSSPYPSDFSCTNDNQCVEKYGEGYVCFTESEGGVGGCVFPRDGGGGGTSNGIRLENPLTANTFEEFIVKLINSLIIFAGPILALIIVIGGFRFVLGGADPKQKEGGKNMIKYGVIGFIIMISAWVLVAILKSIF